MYLPRLVSSCIIQCMEAHHPEEKPQLYRPILLSRRGEASAWLVCVLWLIGSSVLAFTRPPVHRAVIFMGVFLFLAALAISLGNWIDRHTMLSLSDQGMVFANGLRQVHLLWNQVRKVEVFPSAWGNKVRVVGEHAAFDFRTLGEVRVGGEIKGRMGFEQGEAIFKRILEKANLHLVESEQGYYSYGRG